MWIRSPFALARKIVLVIAGVALGCTGSAEGAEWIVGEARQGPISEQQFDAWVFQTAQNEQGCRKHLEAQLGVVLAEAVRSHLLSSEQQEKLQLAGRGDVKRFFDQVAEHRDNFHKLKHDQQNTSEVFKDIQPLQQKLSKGLFEEDSLFRKVLRQTLTDSQRHELDSELQARVERQTQAAVRMALVEFEQFIPLTHKQRQTLSDLLLRKTPPVSTVSSYTKYLMHYRISRIDPSQLEGTFDQAQLAAFAKYAQQGDAYAAFLRQQGLLSDQEAHADD